MTKQHMLDTETTGLNVDDGDRIIEIGIVEYDGMSPTGRIFHSFVNPGDRQIAAGATQVHGITNEMLKDAPYFDQVVNDMLDFLGDDNIVIYNAAFDVGFLKAECEKANIAMPAGEIIDALAIARKRFPGAKLTLDNIAKKCGVDTSKRDKHGAVVDAEILGGVYRYMVQQDDLGMESVQEAVTITTTGSIQPKHIAPLTDVTGTHLTRAETSYTLFSSALTAEKLVQEAAAHDYDSLALTDRYTTAAAMEFADACKKHGISGQIGAGLDISNTPGKPLIFYAANATGWSNLQQLITLRNVTNQGQGLTSSQIKKHSEGLVVTSGGADGAIAEIIKKDGIEKATDTVRYLAGLFHDNFALEITRIAGSNDDRVEAAITVIADNLGLPLIGSMIARAPTGQSEMVEVLKAIGNSETFQPEYAMGEDLADPERLKRMFMDMPEAISNTGWLQKRCDYLPKGVDPMLPRFETREGESEEQALDRLSRAGFTKHLEKVPAELHPEYEARYKYEMDLITGQGFSGYFLIVADFIEWAVGQGIPVGPGRGSGAGSIIAWSLGITKLDPIKMKLLFERFINPDRVSLPDFDIDFCENRRDEVIRYVRKKYGEDRVVAIGAYGKFKTRAGVKDVGRILSQPYGLMDRIAKALPDSGEITQDIINSEEIQSLLTTQESAEALTKGMMLQGLVRNKTRHAAGIVIADRPVSSIVSLEPDPNDLGQAVTQYDMKPVEKSGLVKFDFLGLKTLTVIEQARKNLLRMGIDIDPYEVPLNDEKTLKALSQGRTMGVFQFESGGITRACRDIRVNDFEDIVAIVALYRPGPMEFIPLYARRKKGLEPFGTPHPLLDDVARDTYGILVYQEQVMKAAQVLAGYTLGQADLLRRAMGKKIKEEMDAQREIFIKGCMDTNNIEPRRAAELFEIIERFASYGFNRSHAAAYGLLAYITAWLANNHSAAYYAAALDGASGETEQLVKLAQEARKRNITLLAPKIDGDARHFLPVGDNAIRWSLTAIKGMGVTAVERLVEAFKDKAPESIEELIEKAGDKMNRSQAVSLAASGALDDMFGNEDRAVIIERIRSNYDGLANEAKSRRAGQIGLFETESTERQDLIENIPDEREVLGLERDALGITLTAHPIDSYQRWMEAEGISSATDADPLLEHMPMRIAGQIDDVKITKGSKGWMNIRLSDAQTAIEIGCDESLENAHMLEKGAVIVMQVSGYVKGGDRRLRVDAIERALGEEDKSEPDPILIIETEDDFDRDELRALIAKTPEGEGRIRILQHKNRTTTPPIVTIDEEFIASVEAVRGVKSLVMA